MILALKINVQSVTEQMFAGLTVAIRSSLCATVNNKKNFIPEMEYLIQGVRSWVIMSSILQGHPTTIFGKLSVRKTI